MNDLEKRGFAAKVRAAREMLMTHQEFFADMAMRLEVIADPKCNNSWVNGKQIGINPDYMKKLSARQVCTLLSKHTVSCLNGHHVRRGNRNAEHWTESCNTSTMSLLHDDRAGYFFEPLPDTSEMIQASNRDPVNVGRAPEGIYADSYIEPGESDHTIPDDSDSDSDSDNDSDSEPQPQQQQQPQQPDNDGDSSDSQPEPQQPQQPQDNDYQNPAGQIRDLPDQQTDEVTPAAANLEQEDWQEAAIIAASKAAKAGNLPGNVRSMIEKLNKAQVDWRQVLADWITEKTKRDYSFSRPSRRAAGISRGIGRQVIMPGMSDPEPQTLIVVVDTSGSMDDIALGMGFDEIQKQIDDMGINVLIVECDSSVRGTVVHGPDNPLPDNFPTHGRGGTRFAPAFCWVRDEAEDAINEADIGDSMGILYFTDLQCCDNFYEAIEAEYGREAAEKYGDDVILKPEELPVLWLYSNQYGDLEYAADDVPPWGECLEIDVKSQQEKSS